MGTAADIKNKFNKPASLSQYEYEYFIQACPSGEDVNFN